MSIISYHPTTPQASHVCGNLVEHPLNSIMSNNNTDNLKTLKESWGTWSVTLTLMRLVGMKLPNKREAWLWRILGEYFLVGRTILRRPGPPDIFTFIPDVLGCPQ